MSYFGDKSRYVFSFTILTLLISGCSPVEFKGFQTDSMTPYNDETLSAVDPTLKADWTGSIFQGSDIGYGNFTQWNVQPSNNQDKRLRLIQGLKSKDSSYSFTMRTIPTSGLYQNGFFVFDFKSPDDFKYAGAYTGQNSWEIGHYNNGFQQVYSNRNNTISPNRDYQVEIHLRGSSIDMEVDGSSVATWTFAQPLTGYVGFLTQGSRTNFSNLDQMRPEAPSILRKVTGIEDGQFTAPHIPPVRTTLDGRLAINMKATAGGFRMGLLRPESLDQPFWNSSHSNEIYRDTGGITAIPRSRIFTSTEGHIGHVTICESKEDANPYKCGVNGESDCYDLTLISAFVYSGEAAVKLLGTPLYVKVDNPKTASATIADVKVGTEISASHSMSEGPKIRGAREFFEPMTTTDGKLIVGRIGNGSVAWDNGNRRARFDVAYSVQVPTESGDPEACKVENWTEIKPISHAYHDPDMKDGSQIPKYGFAENQLRDPQGNLIPDGYDIGGTYPWMDRAGNNLFFFTSNASLYYKDDLFGEDNVARYPSRCIAGTSCHKEDSTVRTQDLEVIGTIKTAIVAGHWTHGRMVVLDNMLNHNDYGLGVENREQREIQLYGSLSAPQWTRIGSGRDNQVAGMPAKSVVNTTFIDSTENLFNYNSNLKPITPRDVVWIVNSGRGTDEIAFDDYMDKDVLIISHMTPSMSFSIANEQQQQGVLRYEDGFNSTGNGLGRGFEEQVLLQNAAGSPLLSPPKFGEVKGPGRVEPVAMGGVVGRGFWLTPETTISYNFPSQNLSGRDWYIGLFIDQRSNADSTGFRQVFRFPNGARVSLNQSTLRFQQGGQTVSDVPFEGGLNGENQFFHLGLQATNNGRATGVYINGLKVADVNTTSELIGIRAGSLDIGATSGQKNGLRGWIDEFVVIGRNLNPEVKCNMARGSLYTVDRVDPSDPLYTYTSHYPFLSRYEITGHLGSNRSYGRMVVCRHDYTNVKGLPLTPAPDGAVALREIVLKGQEGHLTWNLPRQSTMANSFCLSCHTATFSRGLGLGALGFLDRPMYLDSRRQPGNPPPLILANLGDALNEHLEFSSNSAYHPLGHLVDPYVFASQYVWDSSLFRASESAFKDFTSYEPLPSSNREHHIHIVTDSSSENKKYRFDMNLMSSSGLYRNGIFVFDFKSPTDFKYVGYFYGIRRWLIGRFDGSYNTSTTENLTDQHALPVNVEVTLVNGNVQLSVDGNEVISHNFGSVFNGQVGFLSQGAKTLFTNLSMQDFYQFGNTIVSATASEFIGNEETTTTAESRQHLSLLSHSGEHFSPTKISAQMRMIGSADHYTNGFIIFDYVDATNFKFAGSYAGQNRWVIGQATNGVLQNRTRTDATVNANQTYNLELNFSGSLVTLSVDGTAMISYDFGSSFSGGFGFAASGSKTAFSHLQYSSEGSYSNGNYRLQAGDYDASNLITITATGQPESLLQLESGSLSGNYKVIESNMTLLNQSGLYKNGFLIFDYISPNNFKFAGTYQGQQRWVIGEVENGVWRTRSQASASISMNRNYSLRLVLDGSRAQLHVDGSASPIVEHQFTSSLEGQAGICVKGAKATFSKPKIAVGEI